MTAAHRERAKRTRDSCVHDEAVCVDCIAAALAEAEEMGRRQGIEEAEKACEEEQLHEDTGDETDHGYRVGVANCIEAIRALAGEGK